MPATEKQRRFAHPVGYGRSIAESDDARMIREARHGDRVAARLIEEGQRSPISHVRQIVGSDGQIDPLIESEFFEAARARVAIHLARGHWEKAKDAIDAIAAEWELRQQAPPADQTEKLHWHVTALFETRTANMLEQLGAATVGALLERLPEHFIKYKPQGCGPVTIKRIARTLVKIGVIDEQEALRRIEEYELGMG